jgi:hypothetical protein
MVSLRSKGRLPFKHWHRFSSLPERNSIWKSLLCACRRHQRCLIGNGDFGTSPPFGSSQASKALDRVNTILSGASLIGAGVTRSYSGSSQGLGRINPRRTFREERQCRLRCGSSHGIESKIGPSGAGGAVEISSSRRDPECHPSMPRLADRNGRLSTLKCDATGRHRLEGARYQAHPSDCSCQLLPSTTLLARLQQGRCYRGPIYGWL